MLYFDVGWKVEASRWAKHSPERNFCWFLFALLQSSPSLLFFFLIKLILGQVFRRFFYFLPQNWPFMEWAGRAILPGSALSCSTTYMNCKEAAASTGKAKMCRAVASGQEGQIWAGTWGNQLCGVSVLCLTLPKACFGNRCSFIPWTPLGRCRCWDLSRYVIDRKKKLFCNTNKNIAHVTELCFWLTMDPFQAFTQFQLPSGMTLEK